MENEKKVGYTTRGDVRGPCGHTHRTIRGSWACIGRDHRGARLQGGYSDRYILHVDGTPLTDVEIAELEELLDELYWGE